MPNPAQFIPRGGRVDESICTNCYLTVRATAGKTLAQAEQEHKCPPPGVPYPDSDV